jgi:hypothetical protein
VTGPIAGPIDQHKPAFLQHVVHDGFRQIVVVQHFALCSQRRLIGGEKHRSVTQMAVVDHVEQHVGGIGSVGQVAHFIDDQHVWLKLGGQRFAQPPFRAGAGKLLDEGRGGDEAGTEAVLDRSVGDGYRQVGFSLIQNFA